MAIGKFMIRITTGLDVVGLSALAQSVAVLPTEIAVVIQVAAGILHKHTCNFGIQKTRMEHDLHRAAALNEETRNGAARTWQWL